MQLLQTLCTIHAPSGNEGPMKSFLLDYIKNEQENWKVKPEIIIGDFIQDCIIHRYPFYYLAAIHLHLIAFVFYVRRLFLLQA